MKKLIALLSLVTILASPAPAQAALATGPAAIAAASVVFTLGAVGVTVGAVEEDRNGCWGLCALFISLPSGLLGLTIGLLILDDQNGVMMEF
ncbi:MAG: hypothetical protein AAB425_01225, partial [Bdellovibrionota bacterium]